jgi:serine/threonine protein kinase
MQATLRNSGSPQSLTREEFLQNLSDSGLWSQQEVEKWMQDLGGAVTDAADGTTLAQLLATSGKLTAFQAAGICERRFSELLIGNYEVLDRIGAGGMGTVFKARHRRMKRVVGVKVLSRNLGQTPSFVQRFQREVEAVARLTHPNIVMAFDADEAEVGQFLVMEFVDGRDLATEVAKFGPMSIDEAADCILQSARAMDYAHGQGVVHRDIKPANLMRDSSGVVKVADLGLARLTQGTDGSGDSASRLTQAGGIMGTADFMAPEQAVDSTTIDQRADIYSLGCTLYFLLTGQPPFIGTTLIETLLKHRDAAIPSLSQARKEVPPALNGIFRRMVAKKASDRFQSMSEVVRAFESIATILAEQAEIVVNLDRTNPLPSSQSMDVETSFSMQSGATDRTIVESPAGAPKVSQLKVLLVEPSRTQSAIIRQYLQTQGVEKVVAVASGQQALEATRIERPDAIVSAMHLSDMTGVELAQQIQKAAQGVPPGFVLISSEAETSEAGSLSQCGKAVVLQKPFSPEKLTEALMLVSDLGSIASRERRDKFRVLIVDDSAPARLHVRNVLKELGFAQFAEAVDGAKAVAAVVSESFDLIVTDYNMPFMDGSGLVGYLRQNPNTASVPIIMVTTEQDPAKLEAVRQLGVAGICDKSFPLEVVRKIVEQVMPKS